jgi:uncharacterized protein DUF3152
MSNHTTQQGPGRYPGDLEAARIRTRTAQRRRHRARLVRSVLALLVGLTLMGGTGLLYLHWYHQQPAVASAPDPADSESAEPAATSAAPSASTSSAPATVPANVPTKGKDTYVYAAGTDQILGTGSAPVKKYLVAMENGTGQDLNGFADAVRRILGDARGWTAGNDVRFQQVAKDGSPNFSITLATQATAERMCALGGIHTDQQTSCRIPGQVVINLTRWLTAIPDYGAPLAEYQAFELNHEVGKELGHPNEACPNPGRPAPVMQKQALGLKGCTPNSWPYVDGSFYHGPVLP